jgi:diguanylate cyclase (GGDEF)-like protein
MIADSNTLTLWLAMPAIVALAVWAGYSYKKRSMPLHDRMLGEHRSQEELGNDLNRIAMTDALTQLPNRRAFRQHLEAGIRRCSRLESSLAVAFIDLDDFKPINDDYGHHVGDEVLQVVAKRLNGAVRRCDLVSRIGGDEFLALIEDIKSNQDIVTIVERIIHSLREVFYVNHHELHISASVGIAVYPRDGDIERLMIAADSAMYHAKSAGKNQFRFYDKEMELASDRLLEMQRDLKSALERNEFEIYYQPKVDSKTYSLAGVEALLRWQHPVKGWIAPSVFILAAERFGLMNQISHWVVEESCRALHRMRSMGIHLQVSINLSTQQFRNPEMVNNVLEVLKRFDLPNSCLMFEVTEATALSNPEQFNARLEEFRSAGIDVAMDDFGAGNSTIAGLQKLNVSQLKLDQSITNKITDDKKSYEIADALIRFAHALELSVVAEGVETEEQCHALTELGCDQMQGYLFGRPVPEERLPQLFRQISALNNNS